MKYLNRILQKANNEEWVITLHVTVTSCRRTVCGYISFTVFTGSIARSARRRYLIYSEADCEVFLHEGATRCTDGVKFGTKEWTDPLLRAKFHPHRCNDKGVGPKN